MRLEEEPVLVEGAARDADALAREVADLPDRRVRRHHHGALGRRVGNEPDLLPLVPEARREEKIGHDHVDLPAQERDPGGVVGRQPHGFEPVARRLVEPGAADRLGLPRDGSERQHADPDDRGRRGANPAREQSRRRSRQQGLAS
jgi:hypothetical protein